MNKLKPCPFCGPGPEIELMDSTAASCCSGGSYGTARRNLEGKMQLIRMNVTDDAGISGPKTYHTNGKPYHKWPPSSDFWTDHWRYKHDGYRIELFLEDAHGVERPASIEVITQIIEAARE